MAVAGRAGVSFASLDPLIWKVALVLVLLPLAALAQEPAPDPESPPAPEMPGVLTMAKALEIFRGRGYDLLVAEANVEQASGNLVASGAIPNPGLSASVGKNFLCATSQDCSAISYGVGLNDNNAISNLVTGKTNLRKGVASSALEAAKLSKADSLRTLTFQVKSAYIQVLLAQAQLANASETRESNEKTQGLMKRAYELGSISDADLATIDVAALESAQAEDQARQNVRATKVALAFLLGFRQQVPDYQVEAKELEYAQPAGLSGATPESLLASALQERPDLLALAKQEEGAQRSIELARRLRIPDFSVGLAYSANGTGDSNISPPNISLDVAVTLPVFYQQQGEIQVAEASLHSQTAQRKKAMAQVVSDVEGGWAQLTGTRTLVERMLKGGLLERAKAARDLIEVQHKLGKASLLDLLNAQRTYTATRTEYATDLANYWTAVAQLEQATAKELPR
jgi:cobalt-zinc-cadmium efflux system outer membrane protein